ncbi:MAG: T9SS type A sorting domain-containing protein [Bacteroidales bacterium]|nr:T9SS type A sorting domain-containing protein [Bacteroidales bacterium]MBP3254785.1 T9SS type A sorting domain-containing protein [Bacteroidales bacterium]
MAYKLAGRLFVACFLLFSCNVLAFADNDSVSEFYTCGFETAVEQNQWTLKNGSCTNKWYIGKPDGENQCLFVSSNGTDTAYKVSASSCVIAYTELALPASDSIILEMDINVNGEGSDYLKVFLAPTDVDFAPTNAQNATGFAAKYYSENAFKFVLTDNYYINKLNAKQTVTAVVKNPVPCSTAKLVFVWRNDKSVGEQPAPVIDNIRLKAKMTVIDKAICKNEYFAIGNKIINQSGIYYDTVKTQAQCDSIIKYNLTVYDTFIVHKDVTICSNGTYVLNSGVQVNKAGDYIDKYLTINGCDSTVYVHLKILSAFDTVIYDTICEGSVYTDYGFYLTKTGKYSDTLQCYNGCDSIVTVDLQVNISYSTTYVDTICTGETYNKNGFNVSQSGVYTNQMQTTDGCDSIVQLLLTVNDTLMTDIYDTICDGSVYNAYNFENKTQTGVYTDKLQSVDGCDSIVQLFLTVMPSYFESDGSDTVEICQGETYEFNGKTLFNSGYYEENLYTAGGCDSLVSVTLVVNSVYWAVDSVTIQSGEKYTLNGKIYTQSGTYTDTLISVNSCDSIVTLYLEVLSSLSEVSDLQMISLFPNPAAENININLNSSANQVNISFFNTIGENIKTLQQPITDGTLMIDVSDLPKGMYKVVLHYDGKSAVKTLIKQ